MLLQYSLQKESEEMFEILNGWRRARVTKKVPYSVKNAVKLLDAPSRNNSQVMKKYNSHVQILFLYTHVLFVQLCYRKKNFDIRTV
jgi:hypothetical protein